MVSATFALDERFSDSTMNLTDDLKINDRVVSLGKLLFFFLRRNSTALLFCRVDVKLVDRLFIKGHQSVLISWISNPANCCNFLALPCSFTVVSLGKTENSLQNYFVCYFWTFCWRDILLWCPLLHNNIMSSAMTSQCRQNMKVCNCLPAVHIWWKVCTGVSHSVCHGFH